MNLSCTGRKAFRRAQEAQSVVYRMRAQGSDVRAFKCPLCGSYHIGKVEKDARV
jgi:predicted RNA-binding Zn-ribbon protein involved in translation (DUF1610 family)